MRHWTRTGRAQLRIDTDTGRSSLAAAQLYDSKNFVEVETRRITEILDDPRWARVDVLKMDVEGMERNIIADGADWLGRVRLLLMEIQPNTSSEKLSSLLRLYGWTLQRLGFHNEGTYLGMPSKSPSSGLL